MMIVLATHWASQKLSSPFRHLSVSHVADWMCYYHSQVPKTTWTLFYLVGTFVNALLLLLAVAAHENPLLQTVLRALQSREQAEADVLLVVNQHAVAFVSFFLLQTTRRFLESLLITEFGDAKMHIGGAITMT